MEELIGGVRVEVYRYQDVLNYIRRENDVSVESIVDALEHWGLPARGAYRAYWPADSYVLVEGVSIAGAREVEKLLNDPRVRVFDFDPPVGATFELAEPRRDGSASGASRERAARLEPYQLDRRFHVRLGSNEDLTMDDMRISQGTALPRMYVAE